MHRALTSLVTIVALAAATLGAPNAVPAQSAPTSARRGTPSRYDDLVTLFTAWRQFQQPKRVNGVPDYSSAAMTAPSVSIRGVVKRFGDVAAVDGVSLDIRKGEFFSLLGPSGCGKTTLLRMIGGFEWPDEGTIAIDGADVTRTPPYERPVNP